jgi:hypothetical protein
MDWGSARPFAVYWWAVASEDWHSPCGKYIPKGAMVAYREWYGCDHKQNGEFIPNQGIRLFADDLGKGIAVREAGDPTKNKAPDPKIHFGVIDPAAFAQDGGPSIAERISRGAREIGGKVLWKKADNKRVAGRGAAGGWDAVRGRLDGFSDSRGDKVAMIYFFDTCIHAIRTMPNMQHDPDNPEDINTDSEDHCADAIRYGCMARPWTKPTPEAEKPFRTLADMKISEISGIDENGPLNWIQDKQRPDRRIH